MSDTEKLNIEQDDNYKLVATKRTDDKFKELTVKTSRGEWTSTFTLRYMHIISCYREDNGKGRTLLTINFCTKGGICPFQSAYFNPENSLKLLDFIVGNSWMKEHHH